jgi:hypothetical protein
MPVASVVVVVSVGLMSAGLGVRVAHDSQLGGGTLLQHLDHSDRQAPASQSRSHPEGTKALSLQPLATSWHQNRGADVTGDTVVRIEGVRGSNSLSTQTAGQSHDR